MEAINFRAKLHKNTHKIVVVLVYALLEWVVIMLLLFNSIFYYFIKKFASFFDLKPICLWCSSIDSLFEPGNKDGSYEGLFCEDHTSQISNLGYCLNHKKLVKIQNRCQECSNISSEGGFEKELGCSCCEKRFRIDNPTQLMIDGLLDQDVLPKEEPQILSDDGSLYLQEAPEGDSSRSTSNSLCNENEDEEETHDVGAKTSVHLTDPNDKLHHEYGNASDNNLQDKQCMESKCLMMQDVETLERNPDERHNEEAISMLEKGDSGKQSHFEIEESKIDDDCLDPGLVIEQLRTELESERSAAAIAANQTMAMITRLQEEKAAIKMEAVQYQRMMEEQAEYDQQALQLLNELVIKREKEKQDVENDLKKAMSCKNNACSSSSCSFNDDSEKLSIDLNREIEEEAPSTGAVLDSVDLVLDRVKNWNMLDGSFEEFEHERLSILHQLKELEEKLFSICDDDQENANLCSVEVNLAPMEKVHPNTMCSAAKKLLPFLENEDGDQGGSGINKIELDEKAVEVETSNQVVAIMKEMDHVYGRLQALEADREFLRHCCSSINKGDKGVNLLEEILQHLRELRNADMTELMICNE